MNFKRYILFFYISYLTLLIFFISAGFDKQPSDVDQKPYTTLLYGNGPGYIYNTPGGVRRNITGINSDDINFVQQAAVPRK